MKDLLETLSLGADYLKRQGVDQARLSMEYLLAHVLSCKRIDLYLMFERPLTDLELKPLRELTKRRASGEPLQHILGTVEFLDQTFRTDRRALIPRPETEELAALLIKAYAQPPPSRILDMGAGSGALGVSLALAFPEATVVLADVSPDALDLARENAAPLNDRATLLETNLFDRVEGLFDWIVANLPYIPTAEIATLSREVRHDPVLALDGGLDGLDVIRQFLEESPRFARPGALLAMETGAGQTLETARIAEQVGWFEPRCHNDLSGVDRFVTARFPN